MLHWPPSEFWQSTPWDLYTAMNGWRRVNGYDKASKNAITSDDVKRLKDLMKAEARGELGNGKAR